MTRMVIFTDLHYSRHEPECRASSYSRELLDKLHGVARIAEKLGAEAVGCSGDWFHRKGKVTFREANDLLSVLTAWRGRGLSVFGILGNHDVAGHSLDSLDSRAVGTLVHGRALHLLDYGSWDGDDVHVTGTSYFHGCDANDENRIRMYGAPPPGDGRVHVHLAHGTLLQRGTFFEDYTVAGELVELLHEAGRLPDVIACGHLHFPEGIRLYDRPDGSGRKVAVCRVGSTARVSRDDLDRQPAVLLVATKGERFVCKEIPLEGIVNVAVPDEPDPEKDDASERIQDFVKILREESEEWALMDHRELLMKVAQELGHEGEPLDVALAAVERRQ